MVSLPEPKNTQQAEPGEYDVKGGDNGDVIQLSDYTGESVYILNNTSGSDLIVKSNGEPFVPEGGTTGSDYVVLTAKGKLRLVEVNGVIEVTGEV